ncbi:MAG: Hsp20/alpha crystallin family protein [Deltaproteobacteria bacterium]|nr:Hsp20/alpha crystallin family protein [Deltaproteobacteria bacterium]
MSELVLWKDQEIRRLRRDMDRLFSRMRTGFGAPALPGMAFEGLFIDLLEREDTLAVKVEIPGIDPEDLEISVSHDRLTISGEKSEERIDDSRYHYRVERRFGSFSRTIRLPCKVETDNIKATYKKGVLSITMPKSKPEKRNRVRIRVR